MSCSSRLFLDSGGRADSLAMTFARRRFQIKKVSARAGTLPGLCKTRMPPAARDQAEAKCCFISATVRTPAGATRNSINSGNNSPPTQVSPAPNARALRHPRPEHLEVAALEAVRVDRMVHALPCFARRLVKLRYIQPAILGPPSLSPVDRPSLNGVAHNKRIANLCRHTSGAPRRIPAFGPKLSSIDKIRLF